MIAHIGNSSLMVSLQRRFPSIAHISNGSLMVSLQRSLGDKLAIKLATHVRLAQKKNSQERRQIQVNL